MEYYKLLKQPEKEKRRVEYYCTDAGEIYSKNLKTGEMRPVVLCHSGKGYLMIRQLKGYYVHRAVYEAITQKTIPADKTVDHIDSNKKNNNFSNLQLLSLRDNIKKSQDLPVDMLDLDEEFIRTFPSVSDAIRWLRFNGFEKAACTSICKACKGIYKIVYSYKWRYHEHG